MQNPSVSFNDSQFLTACELKIPQNENHRKDDTETTKTEAEPMRTQQRCALSSWDLPEAVLEKYRNRGMESMFHWQAECLNNPKVLLENKNLVYSAPTSAGKTLVAEILTLKTVLERRKKVIIILPFVSVVREKMFYFQDILSTSGIRVEGFMGSYNPPGGFKMVQLAICTIEKANGIVNKLLEENSIDDIGAVVIDEVHLLGDPSRGYLLELLLTKLLYMSSKNENLNIQLIGMSATLPNLDLLAKWLNAELYTTNFRPIPLHEYCMAGGEIYGTDFKLVRRLEPIPDLSEDTDNILQICLETIRDSCSILIFCPTKNWCENLAQQVAMAFWRLGCSKSTLGQCLRNQLNSEAITEALQQLERCPVGLDTILKKTVSFGVAFHHAGLTMEERDIIEGAFRNGALRVLIATSTLSSGVNLPARRVVIRTPIFHGKPIDTLTYRQMIGRAGRMGKDSVGESILICQKTDRNIAVNLMSAKLHPIESCLEESGRLKRAVLEVIASGVATTPEDVNLFANCTLLAAHGEFNETDPVGRTVDFLQKNEFIRLQDNNGELRYAPTQLAKACLSSSLPPEDGLMLFEELDRARRCFVLDTELHLLYLITPYSVCYQWSNLDWMSFLNMWEKLSASDKRVADLVGVRESFLFIATQGKINTNSNKIYQKLQVHKRFYTALALQDLINEVPLNVVAEKFQCSRGLLQSLQQSASTFAGMVTAFSRQLGWNCVELLISQFQDRLQFGIHHELLDLLKLPLLNGPRARILYNADIKSLIDLAGFDVCKLENILHSSVPFQSEKGETERDTNIKLKNIWISGKDGLTAREAAVILIEDARKYLEYEMGAKVNWDRKIAEEIDSFIDTTQTSSLSTSTDFGIKKLRKRRKKRKKNIKEKITEKYNISDLEKENVDTINTTQSEINEKLASISIGIDENLELSNNDQICNDFSNVETTISQQLSSISIDKQLDGKSISNYDWSTFNDVSFNDSLFEGDPKKSSPEPEPEPSICNATHSSGSDSLFDDSIHLDSKLCKALDNSAETDNSEILFSDFENEQKDVSFPDVKPIGGEISDDSLFEKAFASSFGSSVKNDDVIDTSQSEAVHSKKKRKNDDNENFLMETPKKKKKSPNSGLEIVDVTNNKRVFDIFSLEIKKQTCLSIAVGCDYFEGNKPQIGQKFLKTSKKETGANKLELTYGCRSVSGIAMYWGAKVYYISFSETLLVDTHEKIDLLHKIFNNDKLTIRIYDVKEHCKVLFRACRIATNCQFEDVKMADWLLEPEDFDRNLPIMVAHYAPEIERYLKLINNYPRYGSIGLSYDNATPTRMRASVEAVISWHVMEKQLSILNHTLRNTFTIEMGSVLCLIQIESNGLGVDVNKLNKLVEIVRHQTTMIEKEAFDFAGRKFSFTSSKDVAKVLGIYKGKRVATSKKVLEQMENPLSNLILQWRKLNSILTKMLYPVLNNVKNNRIYGSCITRTATGRISMHEPNLQTIPRNFDLIHSDQTIIPLSIRSAFVPTKGKIFISADYCQLELRLLAHLSQDPILCKIMRTDEDIFKSVASKLNKIPVNEVNNAMRQRAKQLCYGIIYGMGAKSLSEQLQSTEEEAKAFMANFINTYPAVKKYIQKTVEQCKEKGYVETIGKRRRYLPNINHQHPGVRSQAERQAVNTTIQGSAADLAKHAMVLVDSKIKSKNHGIDIILHIHDELLYEVESKNLNVAAGLIKTSMESVVNLSVPFPIKLKYGHSWGEMKELGL